MRKTNEETTTIHGYLQDNGEDPAVLIGEFHQGTREPKFMHVDLAHLLPDDAQADEDTGEGPEGTFEIVVRFVPKAAG